MASRLAEKILVDVEFSEEDIDDKAQDSNNFSNQIEEVGQILQNLKEILTSEGADKQDGQKSAKNAFTNLLNLKFKNHDMQKDVYRSRKRAIDARIEAEKLKETNESFDYYENYIANKVKKCKNDAPNIDDLEIPDKGFEEYQKNEFPELSQVAQNEQDWVSAKLYWEMTERTKMKDQLKDLDKNSKNLTDEIDKTNLWKSELKPFLESLLKDSFKHGMKLNCNFTTQSYLNDLSDVLPQCFFTLIYFFWLFKEQIGPDNMKINARNVYTNKDFECIVGENLLKANLNIKKIIADVISMHQNQSLFPIWFEVKWNNIKVNLYYRIKEASAFVQFKSDFTVNKQINQNYVNAFVSCGEFEEDCNDEKSFVIDGLILNKKILQISNQSEAKKSPFSLGINDLIAQFLDTSKTRLDELEHTIGSFETLKNNEHCIKTMNIVSDSKDAMKICFKITLQGTFECNFHISFPPQYPKVVFQIAIDSFFIKGSNAIILSDCLISKLHEKSESQNEPQRFASALINLLYGINWAGFVENDYKWHKTIFLYEGQLF